MKLIIFIHTCKLYENSRAKLLEDTWVNNDNDIVLFRKLRILPRNAKIMRKKLAPFDPSTIR